MAKSKFNNTFAKRMRRSSTMKTLLEDKDAIIIRSMTYFALPDHESLKKIIPMEYHDFLHLFGEKLATKLPRRRQFDHAIDIVSGKEVPFGPIYLQSEP